jgi:hypothetical protein
MSNIANLSSWSGFSHRNFWQVEHIIVCGHYKCGGVLASMDSVDLASPLEEWVRNIRDVYRREWPLFLKPSGVIITLTCMYLTQSTRRSSMPSPTLRRGRGGWLS